MTDSNTFPLDPTRARAAAALGLLCAGWSRLSDDAKCSVDDAVREVVAARGETRDVAGCLLVVPWPAGFVISAPSAALLAQAWTRHVAKAWSRVAPLNSLVRVQFEDDVGFELPDGFTALGLEVQAASANESGSRIPNLDAIDHPTYAPIEDVLEVDGCFVARWSEAPPIAWPLAIRVLDRTAEQAIAETRQAHWFNAIAEAIEPDDPRIASITVASSPASLRPRAAALVIALDGLAAAPPIEPVTRIGNAALIARWTDVRPFALRELLAELSHDVPLDVAQTNVRRAFGAMRVRLLRADPEVLEYSRPSRYAASVARSIRSRELIRDLLPQGGLVDSVLLDLMSRAGQILDWNRETAGSTRIVGLLRQIQAQPLPRIPRGTARAAPPVRPDPLDRRLQAAIVDSQHSDDPIEAGPLASDRMWYLAVAIGWSKSSWGSANVPMSLPDDGRESYRLRLHCADPATSDQYVAWIDLPARGESTVARFPFSFSEDDATVKRWLSVYCDDRLLQTATATVDVESATVTVQVEVVAARDLSRVEADDAIVTLETAGARMAHAANPATATPAAAPSAPVAMELGAGSAPSPAPLPPPADTGPGFSEGIDRPDADALIARVVAALQASVEAWSDGTKGHAALDEALRSVARLGRMLSADLIALVPPLGDAKRVQIVEKAAGQWLPIEFAYDAEEPDDDAPLCREPSAARPALGLCDPCPHAAAMASVVCPRQFWGTNRVIERWDLVRARRERIAMTDPIVFRTPHEAGAEHVAFARSIGACSQAVWPETRDALEHYLEAIDGRFVQNWDEIRQAVEASPPPSAQVIFAHHEDDKTVAKMELQGQMLAASAIDPRYVARDGSAPMVFLLGCEMVDPDAGMASFAHRYLVAGAAAVVGTTTAVEGRYVAGFLFAFVRTLIDANAAGETTLLLGEAMRRTRAKLLAKGDPSAFAIVAFGDAGWRIRPPAKYPAADPVIAAVTAKSDAPAASAPAAPQPVTVRREKGFAPR